MPLGRVRDEHGHSVMKTMMGWRAWRAERGLAPMEAATVGVAATPTPWLFGFFESIFVVVEARRLWGAKIPRPPVNF